MNEICTICNKEVNPEDGIYSITGNHYDCEFPNGRIKLGDLINSLETNISKVTGKKKRVRIGQGKPTQKLIELVTKSAEMAFEGEITEVEIWPVDPVWRRKSFDVMLIEGSMKINGVTYGLGSWASVTTLNKYKVLNFTQESGWFDIYPDYDSIKSKKK